MSLKKLDEGKNMGAPGYYSYLLKISWPALGGLLAIYLILGIRLIGAFRKRHAGKQPKRHPWILFLRVIVTAAALVIYSQMFVEHYGDWLHKPSFCRGLVADLQEETQPNTARYYVIVENGEELLKLEIDKAVYKNLRTDDFIELVYLPIKKEVFQLRLLTQRVAWNI